MLSLADVAPMLLTERRSVPPAPGWLYELKHDGYVVTGTVLRTSLPPVKAAQVQQTIGARPDARV